MLHQRELMHHIRLLHIAHGHTVRRCSSGDNRRGRRCRRGGGRARGAGVHLRTRRLANGLSLFGLILLLLLLLPLLLLLLLLRVVCEVQIALQLHRRGCLARHCGPHESPLHEHRSLMLGEELLLHLQLALTVGRTLLLQSRLVGGFARNNGNSVIVSSLLLQRRRANLHAHTTEKKRKTRVHKPRVFVGIASNGVR